MKKYILIILILGIILISGCAKENKNKTCAVDADCKLIYNSCGCEAVSIEDSRTQLKNDGRDCFANICVEVKEKVKAVCSQGKCMRSDQIA